MVENDSKPIPTTPIVLISGAGPSGLMTAIHLRRFGIKVRLIDKNQQPNNKSRALLMQPRTLEIYESLGLAKRAIELGQRASGIALMVGTVPVGAIFMGAFDRIRTPYSFMHTLEQPKNETILREKLKELGTEVEWGTELLEVRQNKDKVIARIKPPNSEKSEEIEAQYLVASDGAKSQVRRWLGIPFLGGSYNQHFLLADVTIDWTQELQENKKQQPVVDKEIDVKNDWRMRFLGASSFMYIFLADKGGFLELFPMAGNQRYRLVSTLPSEFERYDDNALHTTLNFEQVRPSLEKQVGNLIRASNCTWFSVFSLHHRWASQFRAERIFLVGDAAHTHSPVFGLGMNSGLQDATNLAWKLAMVMQSYADSSLLDTYEEERLPIGRNVVRTTNAVFSFLARTSSLWKVVRHWVIGPLLQMLCSFQWFQRKAFSVASQIDIHYRESSVSYSKVIAKEAKEENKLFRFPSSAPIPGERFPFVEMITSLDLEDRAYDSPIPNGRPIWSIMSEAAVYVFLLCSQDSEAFLAKKTIETYIRGVPLEIAMRILVIPTQVHRPQFRKLNVHAHEILAANRINLPIPKTKSPSKTAQSQTIRELDVELENVTVYVVRPDGYVGYRSASFDWDNFKFYCNSCMKLQM